MFNMLGVFAEFERSPIRERQSAGNDPQSRITSRRGDFEAAGV
jgi:hypothetical protein